MIDSILNLFTEYHWYILLTHLALSVVLFFIVNWIGARAISVGYMQMNIVIQEDTAPAFNFLFKVLAPVVFLVLCAVCFEALEIPQFNKNIYFITIFYWLFRIFWVFCSSRGALMNWWELIVYWGVSIGLSIWVYSLIESVEQILPSPRSLLDQLWILIIIFVYSILNKVQMSREGTIKRKNNYICSRYNTLRKKYDAEIKGFFNNDFYEALTYSIMIYEDFNRPIIVRWVEYICFWITKKPHTLGIMQVITDKYINDKESIRQAMSIIQSLGNDFIKKYENSELREYHASVSSAIGYIGREYNGGGYEYQEEIESIFDTISPYYTKILPLIEPKQCNN